MTEKTRLLKSAIDEIDRVLLGNKSADVNEVYLNNAKRFISESMQDQQPAFAVGEYYADEEFIYQILEEQEGTNRLVNSFELATGIMHKKLVWTYKGLREPKPSTAEQIATFKRAEHFASKGRKLDEFRVGDLAKNKECQIGNVQEVTRGGQVIVYFESKGAAIEYLKYSLSLLTLIQTAEELQEVGDGEDREN